MNALNVKAEMNHGEEWRVVSVFFYWNACTKFVFVEPNRLEMDWNYIIETHSRYFRFYYTWNVLNKEELEWVEEEYIVKSKRSWCQVKEGWGWRERERAKSWESRSFGALPYDFQVME